MMRHAECIPPVSIVQQQAYTPTHTPNYVNETVKKVVINPRIQ